MLVRDVLAAHPDATEAFSRRGLSCASCLASGLETLDAVSYAHGIDLDELVDELNALIGARSVEEDAL